MDSGTPRKIDSCEQAESRLERIERKLDMLIAVLADDGQGVGEQPMTLDGEPMPADRPEGEPL